MHAVHINILQPLIYCSTLWKQICTQVWSNGNEGTSTQQPAAAQNAPVSYQDMLKQQLHAPASAVDARPTNRPRQAGLNEGNTQLTGKHVQWATLLA